MLPSVRSSAFIEKNQRCQIVFNFPSNVRTAMISKISFCTSLCVYLCPVFPSRSYEMALLFVLCKHNNWVRLPFPSGPCSAIPCRPRRWRHRMTSKRYFHSVALFLDCWLSFNSRTSWHYEMVSWYEIATLWHAESWCAWKHFGAFHAEKSLMM